MTSSYINYLVGNQQKELAIANVGGGGTLDLGLLRRSSKYRTWWAGTVTVRSPVQSALGTFAAALPYASNATNQLVEFESSRQGRSF